MHCLSTATTFNRGFVESIFSYRIGEWGIALVVVFPLMRKERKGSIGEDLYLLGDLRSFWWKIIDLPHLWLWGKIIGQNCSVSWKGSGRQGRTWTLRAKAVILWLNLKSNQQRLCLASHTTMALHTTHKEFSSAVGVGRASLALFPSGCIGIITILTIQDINNWNQT